MSVSDRQGCRPDAPASTHLHEMPRQVGVAAGEQGPPYDLRYRALAGERAWGALPEAVRLRFSKKIAGGAEVVYRGRVIRSRLSIAGRVLVQALRLIGGPLPLGRRTGTSVVVTVRECERVSGQEWTRVYDRAGRPPQVVRSFKQFGGPTGLEERVGCGVGMRLVVEGLPDGLAFHSGGYFWAPFGGRGVSIPAWLTPGQLTVVHREIDGNTFDFELELVHPVFGVLVSHCVRFADTE